MIKRRALAVLIAIGLAVAVAGCGVPSSGKPIVAGKPLPLRPVQPPGVPPAVGAGPYGSEAAFVVQGYLAAVAGQISGFSQATAANQFLAQNAKFPAKSGDSPPVANVTLVRVVGPARSQAGPNDKVTVAVKVQVVGSFAPSTGEILPTLTAKTKQLDFVVTSTPTPGKYSIEQRPNALYMTEVAFRSNYSPQTVYFWGGGDGSDGNLVPDQRYLPSWLTAQVAAATVVNWILKGPPQSLGASAEDQSKVTGSASLATPTYLQLDNNGFTVNLLPTSMTPVQRAEFVAEVRWSLLQVPGYGNPPNNSTLPPVNLEIANLSAPPADLNITDVNAAAVRGESTDAPPALSHIEPDSQSGDADLTSPDAYVVSSGKVAALGFGSGGGVTAFNSKVSAPADIAKTLADSKNSDVATAALSTAGDQVSAALVRNVSGHQELWISRAKNGTKPNFVKVMQAHDFVRPEWLADGDLAVVADQKKFAIITDNGGANDVQSIPVPGPTGAISAFSVGPDGHRVAFVSAGQIWIGVLSGGDQPAFALARAINLAPELTSVSAVAWSAVDRLVVGGSASSESAVIEAYPDGFYYVNPRAAADAPPDLTTGGPAGYYSDTTILAVESYPISPLDANGTSPVIVQTAQKVVSGRANPEPVIASQKVALTGPFFVDPD